MSTETKAMNKRVIQLAVTTALASTALVGCTGKVAPTHAYSAEKAENALAKGKASKAVQHAEAAVLASPRDAQTRTLLGNAYLEEGRFFSAAKTLGEAVELGDTAPRTVISYALAQIATGDQAGSVETLERFEAALDPADFGLAIALAGRPDYGVHVLSNALRGGQNTAKVRQNLAYAYALQGDWRSARLMAAEDVPANEVGDRMAEWAQMAHPAAFTARVAGLLGVEAVSDPGQPRMLALTNHPSVDMLADQEVVDAGSAAEAPQSDFAFAEELAPVASAPVADDSAEAAIAEAGLDSTMGGIRLVSKEYVQELPAGVVSATRAARMSNTSQRNSMSAGDYNIQLGSYFSMSDAQQAWKLFQERYPELTGAERVITKARVNGKIYYRVAATGFAKDSAQDMCRTVKGKGGGCIAYASSHPLPGALNVVKDGMRVAARQ